MQTKLSSKGQVVLPSPLRRKLGIEAGDSLQAKIKDGSIVLTPNSKPRGKYGIKISKLTGMPMISTGGKGPKITSEMVAEMLADFP